MTDHAQLVRAYETAALRGDQFAADYYDAALSCLETAERNMARHERAKEE